MRERNRIVDLCRHAKKHGLTKEIVNGIAGELSLLLAKVDQIESSVNDMDKEMDIIENSYNND